MATPPLPSPSFPFTEDHLKVLMYKYLALYHEFETGDNLDSLPIQVFKNRPDDISTRTMLLMTADTGEPDIPAKSPRFVVNKRFGKYLQAIFSYYFKSCYPMFYFDFYLSILTNIYARKVLDIIHSSSNKTMTLNNICVNIEEGIWSLLRNNKSAISLRAKEIVDKQIMFYNYEDIGEITLYDNYDWYGKVNFPSFLSKNADIWFITEGLLETETVKTSVESEPSFRYSDYIIPHIVLLHCHLVYGIGSQWVNRGLTRRGSGFKLVSKQTYNALFRDVGYSQPHHVDVQSGYLHNFLRNGNDNSRGNSVPAAGTTGTQPAPQRYIPLDLTTTSNPGVYTEESISYSHIPTATANTVTTDPSSIPSTSNIAVRRRRSEADDNSSGGDVPSAQNSTASLPRSWKTKRNEDVFHQPRQKFTPLATEWSPIEEETDNNTGLNRSSSNEKIGLRKSDESNIRRHEPPVLHYTLSRSTTPQPGRHGETVNSYATRYDPTTMNLSRDISGRWQPLVRKKESPGMSSDVEDSHPRNDVPTGSRRRQRETDNNDGVGVEPQATSRRRLGNSL